MILPIYQVDAFADKVFAGNPAAVCPLQDWLPDSTMQSIARENNLSETAFFVERNSIFHIRWFTPVAEVDLCGHATLAAAFVLYNYLSHQEASVRFESRSGNLLVSKQGEKYVLEFPASPPVISECPPDIVDAFSVQPVECLKAQDLILVFKSQSDVIKAIPNLQYIKELDLRGIAITAQGDDHDIVARFFAPKLGIDEDPVTGSLYTQLVPYWSSRLKQRDLVAWQCSPRGGVLHCRDLETQIAIAGEAVAYLTGEIQI